MSGRAWTNKDDRMLIHLTMDERPALTIDEAAERLGRTPSSIIARKHKVRRMPCPFFVTPDEATGDKWYCDQGNGGHDGTCCGDRREDEFIRLGGNAR